MKSHSHNKTWRRSQHRLNISTILMLRNIIGKHWHACQHTDTFHGAGEWEKKWAKQYFRVGVSPWLSHQTTYKQSLQEDESNDTKMESPIDRYIQVLRSSCISALRENCWAHNKTYCVLTCLSHIVPPWCQRCNLQGSTYEVRSPTRRNGTMKW